MTFWNSHWPTIRGKEPCYVGPDGDAIKTQSSSTGGGEWRGGTLVLQQQQLEINRLWVVWRSMQIFVWFKYLKYRALPLYTKSSENNRLWVVWRTMQIFVWLNWIVIDSLENKIVCLWLEWMPTYFAYFYLKFTLEPFVIILST